MTTTYMSASDLREGDLAMRAADKQLFIITYPRRNSPYLVSHDGEESIKCADVRAMIPDADTLVLKGFVPVRYEDYTRNITNGLIETLPQGVRQADLIPGDYLRDLDTREIAQYGLSDTSQLDGECEVVWLKDNASTLVMNLQVTGHIAGRVYAVLPGFERITAEQAQANNAAPAVRFGEDETRLTTAAVSAEEMVKTFANTVRPKGPVALLELDFASMHQAESDIALELVTGVIASHMALGKSETARSVAMATLHAMLKRISIHQKFEQGITYCRLACPEEDLPVWGCRPQLEGTLLQLIASAKMSGLLVGVRAHGMIGLSHLIMPIR